MFKPRNTKFGAFCVGKALLSEGKKHMEPIGDIIARSEILKKYNEWVEKNEHL